MPGRRLRRSPRRRRPYAEAGPSRGSSTGNSWLCRLELSPPMSLSCLHCVASGLESQACPKGAWASSRIRLLARIRVMTLEPLRRHTGKEQRLYRPHSKYGANQSVFAPSACRRGYSRLEAGDATGAFKLPGERDVFTQFDFREAAYPLEDFATDENRLISGRGAHQARADADQRAKSTIGKCGVVELQVETPADESRVAQRRLDVAGEPRRHNRIGMNEYEGVAAGRRRADVHLTVTPAGRLDQQGASQAPYLCAAVVAPTADD